ncbi:MAG: DNA-processing protein DprA [Segatella maculosa]
MADQQEQFNTLVLSRIGFYNLAGILEVYRRVGSATAIMEQHRDIRSLIPEASPRLVEAFQHIDSLQRWAEAELKWAGNNGIHVLCLNDECYPQRLSECYDAPLVLFYQGTADLNCRRIISIVGTRRCTVYGQDLVRRFATDLKQLCPDALIVSGLAYGVDIQAHRNALQNGFNTVAVLAHGLDNLYPNAHRDTAKQMLHQGGLLTEYASHTNADKQNFVRRNRIVAGLSDACIVVESAVHGGALITARLAREYNRDVFSFPGAVGSAYSEGCNNLIRDNQAALITSAFDFINAMGWQDKLLSKVRNEGIERQLFPELSAEEQLIVAVLSQQNDLQVNMLAVKTNLPIAHLTASLFRLEMKGVVKLMPGGSYHLLG